MKKGVYVEDWGLGGVMEGLKMALAWNSGVRVRSSLFRFRRPAVAAEGGTPSPSPRGGTQPSLSAAASPSPRGGSSRRCPQPRRRRREVLRSRRGRQPPRRLRELLRSRRCRSHEDVAGNSSLPPLRLSKLTCACKEKLEDDRQDHSSSKAGFPIWKDTTSVLQEACISIKALQDQIQNLCIASHGHFGFHTYGRNG
nr:transcription factor bHLH112-like [Ipomoea batatas]